MLLCLPEPCTPSCQMRILPSLWFQGKMPNGEHCKLSVPEEGTWKPHALKSTKEVTWYNLLASEACPQIRNPRNLRLKRNKAALFSFCLYLLPHPLCPGMKKNEPMVSPVWSVDRTQRTGLHDGAQVWGKDSRLPSAVMKAARSHSSQESLLRWLHFVVRGRVCLLETLAREENKPSHR